MRYKSEKINQIMQTEAGDFSIKFFRYRSTTSQRASARWLVVERYLKNLIEKSPVSVCLESSNYSFPDLYLISLCRVTILHLYIMCALQQLTDDRLTDQPTDRLIN